MDAADAFATPFTVAETQADEILERLMPHPRADEHRSRVLRIVRTLVLKCCPDGEVAAFGSVPLRTYLPHGDLDLTVFTPTGDAWLHDLHQLLRSEEANDNAPFVVRDVHFVNHERVEVAVVKCVIDDVPVDVSVNQYGGLRTLGLLESFDRHLAREHLYKRSLLLVKGWCYFESRLLGSHAGLLATLALETLVLCILNLFHGDLRSPLDVLLKFLQYFRDFDWATQVVTVFGPRPLAELAEQGLNPTPGALIGRDFLLPFADKRGNIANFIPKHMNVLDPLLDHNNLGRSVSRASLMRIQRALRHGAAELEMIISGQAQQGLDMASFFRCTLRTLGGGPGQNVNPCVRPDMGDAVAPLTSAKRPRSNVSGSERTERTVDTDLVVSESCWSKSDELETHHTTGSPPSSCPWVIPLELISKVDKMEDWEHDSTFADISDDEHTVNSGPLCSSSVGNLSVASSALTLLFSGVDASHDAGCSFAAPDDILAADMARLTKDLEAMATIYAEIAPSGTVRRHTVSSAESYVVSSRSKTDIQGRRPPRASPKSGRGKRHPGIAPNTSSQLEFPTLGR